MFSDPNSESAYVDSQTEQWPTLVERLEKLVDERSLAEVIETLAGIAVDKADHIRDNWQDEGTARAWDRASYLLRSAAVTLHGEEV